MYNTASAVLNQDCNFCSNTPTNIDGSWADLGGNNFDVDCDGDPLFCNADCNQDYNVDVLDLLYLIAVWDTDNPAGDINEDGWVDVADLLLLIGAWGACP